MSKSIGNVIHPDEIINGTLLPPIKQKKVKGSNAKPKEIKYDALGPDALRLWVASSDYTKDVVIGEHVLKSVHTALCKLRVTFKLLLGALEDFNPRDPVPYESLHKIDRIALLHLSSLARSCQQTFRNYEFHRAVTAINRWANLEFSAFYMETIKDRLYTESPTGLSRRAAQTTLFHIYIHLQTILGPLVPLLVEESWHHAPDIIRSTCEHPLRRAVAVPDPTWESDRLEESFSVLMAANTAIKSLQETARSKKLVATSLQSFVHVAVPEDVTVFKDFESELQDLFVVSSMTLGSSGESEPAEIQTAEWKYDADFELPDGRKGKVWIYAPQLGKCPRCWRYSAPLQEQESPLCQRCEDVVNELDCSSGVDGVSQPVSTASGGA
jgi:isoleucyl-tRNA synthetase